MTGVRLIGAVLVLVAAAFVYTPAVSAACVTIPTAERVKLSSAVFEATVTSARALRPGQVLTVDVKRVWKGDVGTQLTLLHQILESEGGFALVVGETYLMFADELPPGIEEDVFWKDFQPKAKDLAIGTACNGTIPVERAGPLLNELGPVRPSR